MKGRFFMKDCNCIFCKIAGGEIPSATLYEDEEFRVILDVNPATKGHALVLPKDHYANLFEIPSDVLTRAVLVAQKISARLFEGLHATGLNLIQNNGLSAGQTVFHFDLHMIPRYDNDNAMVAWKPGKLTEEDRDQVLALFS